MSQRHRSKNNPMERLLRASALRLDRSKLPTTTNQPTAPLDSMPATCSPQLRGDTFATCLRKQDLTDDQRTAPRAPSRTPIGDTRRASRELSQDYHPVPQLIRRPFHCQTSGDHGPGTARAHTKAFRQINRGKGTQPLSIDPIQQTHTSLPDAKADHRSIRASRG